MLAAPGTDIGRWLEEQKAKITARVTSFQVEVTPAMAAAWLQFNAGNRSPSKMKIRRFVAAMKAGRWALNGESLKFSAGGRLLDGQSRLMAIEQAQVPIVLEVRAGLPDAAQQSMDVGEVRKNAHTLEMLGENYPNMLAPSLKLCWLLERGQLGGAKFKDSPVMENYEVAPMLQRHAGLRASIGWVVSDGHKVKRLLRQSEAAFFHYIFGTISLAKRDYFFDGLVDGIGLTKSSPVYHLREKLLGGEVPRTGEQNSKLRRALVIKAWNHLQGGETVSMLRLLPAERFPAIDGYVAQTVENGAAA